MNRKKRQELKQKILDNLEDETPYMKNLKSLTPLFFNLALMNIGINIVVNSLKEGKMI